MSVSPDLNYEAGLEATRLLSVAGIRAVEAAALAQHPRPDLMQRAGHAVAHDGLLLYVCVDGWMENKHTHE